MKLDPVLLEILVCPDCKGSLTVDESADELVCDSCGLAYPVRDDIPVMLVDEARRPDGGRVGATTSAAAPAAVRTGAAASEAAGAEVAGSDAAANDAADDDVAASEEPSA